MAGKAMEHRQERRKREDEAEQSTTLMNEKSPNKKRKTSAAKTPTTSTTTTPQDEKGKSPAVDAGNIVRPKSRKELRKEKKRQAVMNANLTPSSNAATESTNIITSKKKSKQAPIIARTPEEILHIQNERRKARREQLRSETKAAKQKAAQEREEAQAQLRRQKAQSSQEAGVSGKTTKARTTKKATSKDKKATKKRVQRLKEEEEVNVAQKAFDSVFGNETDEATGTTTCRLGVKYKDVTPGNGPAVEDGCLVTVKYKLTGGKFGAVLDSSKSFNFRLGKGEVIEGWNIGVAGMREGGRRKLIVPPKAGYKGEDIGAGPGGLLHFDITLLSFRPRNAVA